MRRRKYRCVILPIAAISLLVIAQKLLTRQLTALYPMALPEIRQQTDDQFVTSSSRAHQVKVMRHIESLKELVGLHGERLQVPPVCGCENDTKECHAKRLNITIEMYCSASPRRYDCRDLIANECFKQRQSCSLATQRDQVHHIFQEVDCYNFTGKCLLSRSASSICTDHPWAVECKQQSKLGVMVGVILVDKTGYTKFTASVIKEIHNIRSRDVHIFNYGCQKFDENVLRRWYGTGVNIISTKRMLTIGSAVKSVLKVFLKSNYKGLLLLDSEMVFQMHFDRFISHNLQFSSPDFLSLYHSSSLHDFKTDCPKPINHELCQGSTSEGLGVVMTRGFAKKALRHEIANTKNAMQQKLNWTQIHHKLNITVRYPRKSLVMSIGQRNQDPDHCGEYEVPYRFNRCVFPAWVQDGIEFYFDRCTNPNEVFLPGYSIPDIERKRRSWVRPAVSYTLYGADPRYVDVALKNAARVFSIYPGWKIWIYTDWSTPGSVIEKLCEFDIHFVDMSLSSITCKRAWRFLIASEPVKRFVVRDIDSLLIKRGKAAVDEWIQSGRKFHVMRDHVKHAKWAMNAGLWGATGDAFVKMKELLECADMKMFKYQDTVILNKVAWKVANKSVWAHDSHPLSDFGEYHPFPLKQEGKSDFVGRVVPYQRKV